MLTKVQSRKRRFGISRRLLVGVVLIIAMIAIAAGYTVSTTSAQPSQAQTRATVTVTRGKVQGTVSGSGTIAAAQTVDLAFQQSGVVKTVAVETGAVGQAGPVLAELDATDLQLSLSNAVATLNQQQAKYDQTKAGSSEYDIANAQSAVDAAQATYDAAVRKSGGNDNQMKVLSSAMDKAAVALQKAKSDYDQAVADGKTELIAVTAARQSAQIDYDSALANYNLQVASLNDSSVRTALAALNQAKTSLAKLQAGSSAQDLQIAQAQLEQMKIAVQQAQYKLRGTQIVAPLAGIVTAVNLSAGSSASGGSGASSSTSALTIMDRSTLHINLKLSENDVVQVQKGQPVDLSIDSIPAWQAQGVVDYIASASETSNGVVTYATRVAFTDADARVKVGMSANVTIIIAQKDNVLLVPNSALLPNGAGHSVQTVDLAGRTSDVPVETGISDGTYTEILSGVSDGQKIVAVPTSKSGGGQGGPGGPLGGG